MGKKANRRTPLRLNLTPDDVAAWNFVKTAFPGRTPGEIICPMIHSLASAVQQVLHEKLEEKKRDGQVHDTTPYQPEDGGKVRQGETPNESPAVDGPEGRGGGDGVRGSEIPGAQLEEGDGVESNG